MKKFFILSFTSLLLLSITKFTYAGTDNQYFKVHVTTLSFPADEVLKRVCFATTDILESIPCADNNIDVYVTRGPKNWNLSSNGYWSDHNLIEKPDASCKSYFDETKPKRSPDGDGILLISLTGSYDESSDTISYSNCSEEWIPANSG